MYRSALRSSPRAAAALRQAAAAPAARRFASTTPAKKRTWKSAAVRLGLVGGALYWYSTSPFFAEEVQPAHVAPPAQFSDDDLPTVEAVIEQKRKEAEARVANAKASSEADSAATELAAPTEGVTAPDAQAADSQASVAGSSPEALEAEAGQQGAFNPETGEINWDCPCLGGMADGPCGEEFKAAFSCFVYSKEEPKGMDCIDKFQHMQDCFRLHPEVYGEELADDEEASAGEGAVEAGAGAEKAVARDVEGGTITSSDTTPSTPSPQVSGATASVEPAAAQDALAANSADQKKPEPSEQKQEKADQ